MELNSIGQLHVFKVTFSWAIAKLWEIFVEYNNFF